MKKLLSIFLWITIIIFSMNCRGPEGPPGPQGLPGPVGPAGPEVLSLLYETEPYSLTAANEWTYTFAFPEEDLQYIYAEDVVLVYLLVDEIQNSEGDWFDIWRLMPITYFEEQGILNFNYDFTQFDVAIFAEANFDKEDYSNLISRIVIVPADWAPNARTGKMINFENYDEVMNALGLPITKSTGKPFKK